MNYIPSDIVLASITNNQLYPREYPELSMFSSVEINFFLENMCVN